jgi:diguanylate cyclase (GGDEF)-like protein
MLDLVGFKAVKDIYGYGMGDPLLTMVANRLYETLRSEDTLARVGGDEFVLILSDNEIKTLPISLRRLLVALSRPYKINRQILEISGSLDITTYPNGGEDLETLFCNAD